MALAQMKKLVDWKRAFLMSPRISLNGYFLLSAVRNGKLKPLTGEVVPEDQGRKQWKVPPLLLARQCWYRVSERMLSCYSSAIASLLADTTRAQGRA